MANQLGKTVASNETWKSPDGSRILYEVVLEIDGAMKKFKSWSGKVAQVGFSGEIETYEKDGRDGKETFVKQAPKEGGFGGRQPKDEAAIKAMWAIGQAVQLYNALKPEAVPMNWIEQRARELFPMVDRVKTFGDVAAVIPVDADVLPLDDLPEDF